MAPSLRRKSSVVRNDSIGGGAHGHHSGKDNFDSLTYVDDESDIWKAAAATEHYRYRGNFWNSGKHATLLCYLLIASVGIVQATVAYLTNLTSAYFISVSIFGVCVSRSTCVVTKFSHVYSPRMAFFSPLFSHFRTSTVMSTFFYKRVLSAELSFVSSFRNCSLP